MEFWGEQTVRVDGHGWALPRFGDDLYAAAYALGGWPAVRAHQEAVGDPSSTLCQTCGHRHHIASLGSRHGFVPSPVAQARRDAWASRRELIARLAEDMIARAIVGMRLRGEDISMHEAHYASSPDDLAEGQNAGDVRPWTPEYLHLHRGMYRLAVWLVPDVDGEMPERVCSNPACGSRDRVDFREQNTLYMSCDGLIDPDANDAGILCAKCDAENTAAWDEQWAEYRSSQGM